MIFILSNPQQMATVIFSENRIKCMEQLDCVSQDIVSIP